MQSEGLIFIFFLLFIIPIIILFANPNVFLAILSVFVLLSSIKNINGVLFGEKNSSEIFEEEIEEEFEDLPDIDLKKLLTGIKVVGNIIVVLFFSFCMFFVKNIIFKEISILIISYRIIHLINMLGIFYVYDSFPVLKKFKGTGLLVLNSFSIIIITVVCCNKFIKFYF
ncbi:MAG: hypothetical protein Q8942_14835 [Bacillota bacterium]|nr:hypothetical protein [Bacillota bacterium]